MDSKTERNLTISGIVVLLLLLLWELFKNKIPQSFLESTPFPPLPEVPKEAFGWTPETLQSPGVPALSFLTPEFPNEISTLVAPPELVYQTFGPPEAPAMLTLVEPGIVPPDYPAVAKAGCAC